MFINISRRARKWFPLQWWLQSYPWLNHILTSSFVKSLLPSATDPIGFGKIIGFVPLLIHLRGWLREIPGALLA